MQSRVDQLSPRQRDCLRLVYQRKTTKEIAQALGIMPGTVATYCTEAIAILGARNRRHAAELLHAHEGTPSEMWPPSEGLPRADPAEPAVVTERAGLWWGALSVMNRDADNDLGIIARLIWIFGLAIALAIGFGALASAVRTIGDIVTVGGRR